MVTDIMIVDDDKDIHEYLKETIDWSGLGVRLSCSAMDSITAQELFQLFRPKIVFMDICISNIHGKTGLDLAKEFYEQDPSIKVIVITGYTDFEYAKEAISIGVMELIQKPLNQKEVKASILKALSTFEQERSKYFAESAIKQIIDNNIDALRRNWAKGLLNGESSKTKSELIEQQRQLSLDVIGKKHVVVKILVKPKLISSAEDLYSMVIKNYFEAKLTENGFKRIIYLSDQLGLDCLIAWSFDNGDDKLEALLNKLIEESGSNLNIKIKMGVGETVDSIAMIKSSAMEAELCLGLCDFDNEPTLFFQNFKTIDKKETVDFQRNMLGKIEKHVRTFDYKKINQEINETFDNYCEVKYSIEDLRRYAVEYLLLLSKVCETYKAQLSKTEEFNKVIKQVLATRDTSTLKTLLLSMTYEVFGHINKRISDRKNQKNQLVMMSKEYVKKHITNSDLGFDEVCEHIGLSKGYFGRLFHKEEGMSFNTYLNKERIWQAKTLLSKTNLRVSEVATESGFDNSKYFSVVFKSLVGVTPLEFRRTKRTVELS